MANIAPMNYIEITEDYGESVPRVAGTRIRVSEIVMMHIKNGATIDWIVENYEVLDRAKIHAALAYYYDHQDEIETEMQWQPDLPPNAMTLEELKAKIKARQ